MSYDLPKYSENVNLQYAGRPGAGGRREPSFGSWAVDLLSPGKLPSDFWDGQAFEGPRRSISRNDHERPNARHPLAHRATTAAGAGDPTSPACRRRHRVHPRGVLADFRGASEHLLPPPRPAAAFSLGIPGPKELLREQKKKSARFLLAPIAASRESLVKAQELLASANASADDAEEVRGRMGAAVRDCVPRQRNSVVAFQSRTGVEVCTFSLILNNAASLLADKDPLKVEADARLAELIRSFSDLGTAAENSNFELSGDREKMKDSLQSTISAIDRFEQGVKDCLGV